MKKHFLFFAMFLLGGLGLLRAQETVLFSDDFESGNLDNWTLIDADGDSYNWNAIIPNYSYVQAHSGRYSAYSFSWKANVVYTPDNYLVSPLVEGATKVHYYVIVNADFPDHYGVAVSSTGTDPGDFSVVFEETVPGAGWIEKEVELPAGTKYVAFRHYDSDDNESLFIDDVTISAEINAANVLSTANWYGCMAGMGIHNGFYCFNLHQLNNLAVANSDYGSMVGSYANGYFWSLYFERSRPKGLAKAPVDNNNKTVGEPELVAEEFFGSLHSMAINPSDGNMYYVEVVSDTKGQYRGKLFYFNPSDPAGTQTVIGEMDIIPLGLAINRNGDAYCLNDDCLYRLNLSNGSTTLVGATGFSVSSPQNLAFDLETNELIWAVNRSVMMDLVPVAFYKVDTETAAAQFIGEINGCFSLDCLFSVPNDEGVADTQGQVIALWPNPAGNTLYLEDMDGETVRVYDYTGRLVLQETYRGQLDVSGLAPGLYVIAVKGRSMRFVKE